MPLHAHFNLLEFSDSFEEFLSLLDPDITISVGKEIPFPATYDILIHPSPTKEWIESSPNLKAVVIPWAGVPDETLTLIRQYPKIGLHNLHHNNYNTAELGFTLLLAAAKRLIPLDQALRHNDWTLRDQKPLAILLRGKKVLILGFGEIGQALGAYCSGFGMEVMAIRKHPDHNTADGNIPVFPIDQLQDLLPHTNVLLIALPLTGETENLIGEKELYLLPKGSILINIGRGPIVNQFALFKALKSGHLRAAGSDVWYNYPDSENSQQNTPPADVPFGELENFVLSPHRGGLVEESEEQRATALAELLNAANRNQPIPNKVDIEAGY